MSLNIEQSILDLTASVSRIEQQLRDHIASEDKRWEALMKQFEQKMAKRTSWWQTVMVAVASSGIIAWFINWLHSPPSKP